MAEWELEFGADEPSRVDSVLKDVVDGRMAKSMSANQRAAAAWYRSNGDRERAHTAGVFLRKARKLGAAPVLVVYVDTHAMATDFGVNKDIYLSRLANVGFAVSGIEFVVSRRPREERKKMSEKDEISPESLPELSDAEREEVARLAEDLPDTVRFQAIRAMELSLRRGKLS